MDVIFMEYSFNVESIRTISAANYQTYIHGVIHPDRVMKDHDFVYILEGEWEILLEGTAYQLQPNDMILLPADMHHYGFIPCKSNTKTMYIHSIKNECDGLSTPQKDIRSCYSMPLESVIHCAKNPNVKIIFQQIISTFWKNDTHSITKLSALFQLLLCELMECTRNSTPSVADIIVNMIHQHPQNFYTSKDFAHQLGIHEKTLNNLFKQKYDMTIYRYQMDAKIQAVSHFLLNHENVKLYEVAINFGFYDEFHLSKTFKKYVGLSPNQYRLNSKN